jgi:RHS repeat-associated protein
VDGVCGEFGYYPFGMMMPGRKYAVDDEYRYGFNGKEKDNEIKGEGNAYDYTNRIYDPRIGRWFKPDALEARLPMMSSYHFGLNNPLRYSDHKGDYVIDEATAKAYPNLRPALAALVIELQKPENEKKVAELVRLGQFKDRQAFFDVLTDGKGPKLSVRNLVDVDIKKTKVKSEVQVPNPLGPGTFTQERENELVEYPAVVTDEGTKLGITKDMGNPAAITKTVGGLAHGPITLTKDGKLDVIFKLTPKVSEVVLDDNTANILNNTEIPLEKSGAVNIKKASNALLYFLKTILHETGHVGDNTALLPGVGAPLKEIGKESENEFFDKREQKNLNGSQILYENKPKK